MHECGAPGIYSGYGLSETFSGVSIGRNDASPTTIKQISSVGVIQAGMIASIFDEDGNELSYNQRGELKVKAPSKMKGYYNKSHLTDETVVDDWIQTGDMAEIDDNGFLYIWGRLKNSIKSNNGDEIYLFDIENMLRDNKFLHDVAIIPIPIEENDKNLVAHIVWNDDIAEDKQSCIVAMNEQLKKLLPNDIEVSAYAEHDKMLPYSPTTLKKDRNKMSRQTSNYIQILDGKMKNIEFDLNENGKYSKKCVIIEKDKIKSLSRK